MELQRDEKEEAAGTSSNGVAEDNDMPCLSWQAVAALQEFLLEKEEEEEVSEDWRLSQFWYSATTAKVVAEELQRLSRQTGSAVACIACPTLYLRLKRCSTDIQAQIFEFDKRFEKYGTDYIFYDYNQPEELPFAYQHKFEVVVADPPYLSDECLSKISKTMKLLGNQKNVFFLLLTGKVQQELAAKLLNLRPCRFRPTHRNKLGNEFMLFTNYDPEDRLDGWEDSN